MVSAAAAAVVVVATTYLLLPLGAVVWECQTGVAYVENRCGKCTCDENRVLSCDPRVVCLDRIESILFNCEVGTKSSHQCNQCECVKDVGTVCTDNPCPKQ